MTPQVYQQASDLFDQALLEAPSDPERWVESMPADPEAKREAARLLSLHREAGSAFLGAPIESARATWLAFHLAPGFRLANRYSVVSLLGEGGMGEVYLVEDEELKQRVALKTLRPHLAIDPVALERFRREVLLLREIHHPNVIRILDFGRDGEHYFYTMEHLSGETLASRLTSTGPFAPGETKDLTEKILDALDEIHSRGIIHRDLKPANIFITAEGRIVLMDFGIATTKGQTSLTDANSVLGSLDYMSPEQLQGHDTSAASDYYSFGLLLHEVATGKLAYSGTSPVARAFRRLNQPRSAASLSGPIGRAIDACLRNDSAQRPLSSDTIRRLLAGHRIFPKRRISLVAAAIVFAVLLWTLRPQPIPENPELNQHLKLAAQFATRRTASDLENARKEYDAALKLNERSAEAWTGLAEVYSTINNFGFGEPKPTLMLAAAAAKRAISLDQRSGSAQAVYAYIVSLDLEKWRTANPLFQRAVELDPSQIRTRLWYGAYLGKLGRFEEALAQLNTGLALDPGSMSLNHELAAIHTYARNYPAAEAVGNNLVRLQPREPSSHLALCRVLLVQSKLTAARRSCEEALRQDNSNVGQAIYASVLAADGQIKEARSIARKIENQTKNVAALCDLYQRIGEPEQAIRLLETAFAKGDSTIELLGFSPRFDNLRSAASVQRMRLRLGFVDSASNTRK